MTGVVKTQGICSVPVVILETVLSLWPVWNIAALDCDAFMSCTPYVGRCPSCL